MSNNNPIFDRDLYRANLLSFTRRAYRALPRLDKPRILDVGCGTGVSTLELARISGGDIVAVDIDGEALDKLSNSAESEGLSSRITAVRSSMLEMDFPPNSFDIIWTEGAISNIGFERGLSEWRNLLVTDGYLVIHDAVSDLQRKTELTLSCGYTILDKFELPPDIWWKEYYAPLKRQLETLRETDGMDKSAIDDIKTAEREIEEFDPASDRFGSVFFILKKV